MIYEFIRALDNGEEAIGRTDHISHGMWRGKVLLSSNNNFKKHRDYGKCSILT